MAHVDDMSEAERLDFRRDQLGDLIELLTETPVGPKALAETVEAMCERSTKDVLVVAVHILAHLYEMGAG